MKDFKIYRSRPPPLFRSDCNAKRIETEESMGFNYGREKRKFDKEWERLEAEYTAAGMPRNAIECI